MTKYIVKRVLLSLVTLWLLVTIVFLMSWALPSDPANRKLRRDKAYPAKTPQISEIIVDALAMNIVFHSQVVKTVSLNKYLTWVSVGSQVQNGA